MGVNLEFGMGLTQEEFKLLQVKNKNETKSRQVNTMIKSTICKKHEMIL